MMGGGKEIYIIVSLLLWYPHIQLKFLFPIFFKCVQINMTKQKYSVILRDYVI